MTSEQTSQLHGVFLLTTNNRHIFYAVWQEKEKISR